MIVRKRLLEDHTRRHDSCNENGSSAYNAPGGRRTKHHKTKVDKGRGEETYGPEEWRAAGQRLIGSPRETARRGHEVKTSSETAGGPESSYETEICMCFLVSLVLPLVLETTNTRSIFKGGIQA